MNVFEKGKIYRIKSEYNGLKEDIIGKVYDTFEFKAGFIDNGVVVFEVIKDFNYENRFTHECMYYDEIYYVKKLDSDTDIVSELL